MIARGERPLVQGNGTPSVRAMGTGPGERRTEGGATREHVDAVRGGLWLRSGVVALASNRHTGWMVTLWPGLVHASRAGLGHVNESGGRGGLGLAGRARAVGPRRRRRRGGRSCRRFGGMGICELDVAVDDEDDFRRKSWAALERWERWKSLLWVTRLGPVRCGSLAHGTQGRHFRSCYVA